MFRLILLSLLIIQGICAASEEDEGVKYASKCEVCKVLATELQEKLLETGKTSEVLEMGYCVDCPKKKKEYKKSELRFIETLDGVCDRILEYNIHKERQDSTRFAKGMSQTFQTLHGLVDKGVKVDLGIPYELWDKPSVEITHLKQQCESLVENHEDDIRDWYEAETREHKVELIEHLCGQRALKNQDSSCLREKGDTGKLTDGDRKTKEKSNNKDSEESTNKKLKTDSKDTKNKSNDPKKTKKSEKDKTNKSNDNIRKDL